MKDKHTLDSMMTMARGFMASRVLLSGAELDIFSLVAQEPLTAEKIASAKNADLRAMTILLDALSALGFLVKSDGRYRTEPSAIDLLTSQAPDSVLPMVLHMGAVWRNWSQITDIVLGRTQAGTREKGALADANIKAFIGAMHVVASKMAPQVVAAIDPGPARHLIDVGGGSGTYTLAFLAAVPELKATLFDLPPVIEMARERVQAAGLADRVTLVAGDFYQDELPVGQDLALLSAIIHQNSPAQNENLFAKTYRCLDKGGRIVIRDHVMSPDRTQPLQGALFAVNMLAGTSGGRTYTFDEIEAGLTTVGFTRIRLMQKMAMFSLVEGFKPQ
ncbi:MAG: methyltransferase [Desulfosarcinaceae bacterium]|jgi:precorrin-6B methylase 2